MNVADESHPAAESKAPAESGNAKAAGSTASTPNFTVETLSEEDALQALQPVRNFAALLIAVVAAITCTFGNLAAYAQTNIKRLLAYSTIAHAGYMMMAVPPAIVLAQYNPPAAESAIGALALYLVIYLFMNLTAFAIVAFVRNRIGSEEIADYAGLVRHSPGVVVCFIAVLFSLVGLPPLAGFIGKFAVFAALVSGYQASAAAGAPAAYLIVLLVIAGINTAISLFYYLRVAKVMTIEPEPANRPPFSFPIVSLPGAYLAALTVPILLLIVSWDWVNQLSRTAAQWLFIGH
jgi:NADH-quinone oxidoreductase subunit N